MRLLISLAFVGACSGADDAAGSYGAGRASFVLRGNGRVERLPTVDGRCARDPAAIEACEDKQTWKRTGDKVVLMLGAIRDEMMCECDLDRVEGTYRNGELVINGERTTRAR